MITKAWIPGCIGAVLTLVLVGCSMTSGRPLAGATLEHGARSPQDLVDGFLLALRDGDPDALRRLRVNEREYRSIILPGSGRPGEPAQQYASDFSDYLWSSYQARSASRERDLLAAFGGKTLLLREMTFDGGEKAYAGYRAHRKLSLHVATADAPEHDIDLELGSVAEVGHRFKFLTLTRD